MLPATGIRALIGFTGTQLPYSTFFCSKTLMESPPKTLCPATFSTSPIISPPREAHEVNSCEGEATAVSLREWQAWGTASPIPAMVAEVLDDLKALATETDARMTFGGKGGKLKGDFKVKEDKKHRAKYKALADSETKLHFFSARQIACRLIGSRNYLCQKCWLPLVDCMCSRVENCSLWHGIRFWLYMHPKDFLRQNNTGKLLWQVFGVQAATLCLFGIAEHEEIMWNEFMRAGKRNVWCLYPNKNALTKTIQDIFAQDSSTGHVYTSEKTNGDHRMNFVLIDGTWSNSAAMFRRLKLWMFKSFSLTMNETKCQHDRSSGFWEELLLTERATLVWGEDFPCISLTTGASSMHKLRPQPSWDRTCTAAAAISLLYELQLLPQFSSFELGEQAEALEDGLEVLLEALTGRRLRMGRSITRKERHRSDIC